LSIFKKSV